VRLKTCGGCFRNFPPQELKSGRCPPCSRAKERALGTRTSRGYDNDWLRLSANAIAQHPYCSHCGSTEDLTADHIVPKARGGRNVLSNVQVLSRSCNSAKGDGGTPSRVKSTQRNPPPGSRELNVSGVASDDQPSVA
jgi:5-methylcytosine-specific restriction endonuclease McrA